MWYLSRNHYQGTKNWLVERDANNNNNNSVNEIRETGL